MRSGLIVYLVGDGELPEGVDLAGLCNEMGFPADRVELVGSQQGFYEVEDAWHYLFTKGYGNIQLLVAQRDQDRLRPLNVRQPLLRLSG
jgi:hypothetical protein